MRPLVITWPASNTTAVAALQTLAAPGKLTLNGSLSNPNNIPGVVFQGITRNITLTSLNNLSAATFTINGVLNNAPISETIAGPNHNTVTSVNFYDAITSISVNAAVTGVSVGTGLAGATRWISANYNLNRAHYSVQVVVTGTIQYDFGVTLDDPNVIADPDQFGIITAMNDATTTQFASFNNPIAYASVTIDSAGTDGTGSLVVTFLQQGISS